MVIAGFFAFLLTLSTIFALLEIQIEGKNGWASSLPCWKIEKGWFVHYFWGGRPLTGYHLYLNLFELMFLHFPLFFTAWSWRFECLILGFLLAMWQIEDFLWFVLNPNFGLKKFKPEYIPWHPGWTGPVPTCYWGYPVAWAPLIFLGLPILTSR